MLRNITPSEAKGGLCPLASEASGMFPTHHFGEKVRTISQKKKWLSVRDIYERMKNTKEHSEFGPITNSVKN